MPEQQLKISQGLLRLRDTGGRGPVILMTPDGPNVIEHHDKVIALLAPHARVICFDMPGFGFSKPAPGYGHRVEQGGDVVLGVMDALDIREASLLFSCANGFYAIAAAKAAPQRIRRLVLTQTPGLSVLEAWKQRNVPKLIQTPILGQITMRLARRKFAHAWYSIALNEKSQRTEFRAIANQALDDGACFCLADVVQGMGKAELGQLQGVKQPTTLLWGDADRSHKGTQAESLQELLPHAQIRHCPDCGHFPDLEQPKRYAETVLNSLSS
jgi:pimeloyl-ACP methyl ester carboxylesterase